MSITLSKLCKDTASKYNMCLVAGKQGMENTVRWVHIIEDREVPEFLHGNELVFTTGIGHVGSDPLLNFVKKLWEHHAAGVVVNIGPYLSEISANVIEFCNRNDFPIFTIPWKVYLIDVTYDLCRRIIENEKFEATASEAFRNLISDPKNSKNDAATLERQGFSYSYPYRVLSVKFLKDGKNVTAHFTESHTQQLWNILARSAQPSAMFKFQDQLVVVRQNSTREAADHIDAALAKAMSATKTTYVMGISAEERGFLKVPDLLQQAESAGLASEIYGKRCTFYQDIGIRKLILCQKDHPTVLKEIVEDKLHPILEYDQKNGTDLAKVLYKYLTYDGSVQAVADELGIHRNTVNCKIKQIKELLHLELTGQEKMELFMAFTVKEVVDFFNTNGGNKHE